MVEGMGADVVDINMGCPVPKIAKHQAGCSLMKEPEHAARIVAAMVQGGVDSGDREDAQGLGRHPDQRRRRGRARRAGRRRGHHRARTHGPAELHRPGRLGLRGRGGASRLDSGVRLRRLRGAAADRRSPAPGRERRVRRPRRAAQPVDSRAGHRHARGPGTSCRQCRRARALPARVHRPAARRSLARDRGLPPSRSGRARRTRSAGQEPRALGGEQGACACARGTPRASTAARTCGLPSTPRRRSPNCATSSTASSAPPRGSRPAPAADDAVDDAALLAGH